MLGCQCHWDLILTYEIWVFHPSSPCRKTSQVAKGNQCPRTLLCICQGSHVLLGGAGEALFNCQATCYLGSFPRPIFESGPALKKTSRVTASGQIQPFILSFFMTRGCWGYFYKLHSWMSVHPPARLPFWRRRGCSDVTGSITPPSSFCSLPLSTSLPGWQQKLQIPGGRPCGNSCGYTIKKWLREPSFHFLKWNRLFKRGKWWRALEIGDLVCWGEEEGSWSYFPLGYFWRWNCSTITGQLDPIPPFTCSLPLLFLCWEMWKALSMMGYVSHMNHSHSLAVVLGSGGAIKLTWRPFCRKHPPRACFSLNRSLP